MVDDLAMGTTIDFAAVAIGNYRCLHKNTKKPTNDNKH